MGFRRLPRSFFGALLVLFCLDADEALASRRPSPLFAPPAMELQARVSLELAKRKGSASCWVALDSDRGELCLSRELWLRWLASDPPSPLSGRWVGHWKTLSPPQNHEGQPKVLFQRFQATALPDPRAVRAARGESLPWRGVLQRIERLREGASQRLAPHDPLGMLRQLLVNEKTPGSAGGMLRLLGFVHLLSATGIHLYALADLWGLLFRAMAAGAAVPVRVALPLARAFSFASWFFAWILAGGRPGMLRPWLIVIARNLAQALGFRWRRWAPLGWALLIDLLAGVWLALHQGPAGSPNSGRVLYALAVGGGMMALRPPDSPTGAARTWRSAWRDHAKLAVGSWVFTALYEAWHDGLLALATPLLSLITIPVFSLLLFPALCVSSIMGGDWGGDWASPLWELASEGILELARASMQLSTVWVVSRPVLVAGAVVAAMFLAALAGFSASTGKRFGVAALGLAFAALLGRVGLYSAGATSLPVSDPGAPKARRVELLDVGQGDAALVIDTRGKASLIDSGSERALPEDEWIRLFARRGITRLDSIALTHLDEDHSGGARRISRLLPVGCVASSLPELSSKRGSIYRAELRPLGVRVVDWDHPCVPWEKLGPAPARRPAKRHPKRGQNREGNDQMSALWVPLLNGGYFLTAGDAGLEDELRAAHWALRLSAGLPSPGSKGARILKISHHGSRFSSGEPMLRLLRPTEAWASAGVGNGYGHPSIEILFRFKSLGIRLRRTDYEGLLANSE